MRLYLIRHPPPAVAEGTCYGRTDLPLAGPIDALVARLRPHLPAGLPLYSSPLQRCRQLAEALHPRPHYDPRLQEMDFGLWEQQSWSAIDRQAIDQWAADPLHFCPPRGESAAQLVQRVQGFLAELCARERSGDCILVTHAGVIKALQGLVHRLPVQAWMALGFDYGSLTLLDVAGSPTAAGQSHECQCR